MSFLSISVRDICTSIGQNSDIGADLEHMLSIHSNLRIVQSDFREFDMSKQKNRYSKAMVNPM